MCWSERVSWLSFLVGTIVNAWVAFLAWNSKSSRAKDILALCLLWQWVLFVQVSEAFIWRGNTSNDETMTRNASASQYVLIITQPIILGLAFMTLIPESPSKYLAGLGLGVYVLWCLYSIWKVPDMGLTKPGCEQRHLEMTWWSKIPGGAIPYLVAIAAVVLLMIRPMNIALASLAFVFGTLLLSAMFYSCSKGSPGGTGSMWCWFAVSAPLFTWFIYSYYGLM